MGALPPDTQYCMHEGVCAFPSVEFYKKKLKTWQGLRQPPSIPGHLNKEGCSVIFGDVWSPEDSLLVLTDQGGKDSKGWLHPHPLVPQVCITKQLTLRGTVDPEDIAILEPYHAQVSEIRKRLEEAGVTGVTVCSATQRQGEAGGSRAPSAPAWRAAWTRGTRSWLKSSWAQEALCVIGDQLLPHCCCPLWSGPLDTRETQRGLVLPASCRSRGAVVSSWRPHPPTTLRLPGQRGRALCCCCLGGPLSAGSHVLSVLIAGHLPAARTRLTEQGSRSWRGQTQSPPPCLGFSRAGSRPGRTWCTNLGERR
uniref:DNA2/NAM7 helicase-like C-terminal domain-containing protein n=1 Tax=Phocoena sinus TaxID=42100 RepID=A0A8C9CRQ7_PHOSS